GERVADGREVEPGRVQRVDEARRLAGQRPPVTRERTGAGLREASPLHEVEQLILVFGEVPGELRLDLAQPVEQRVVAADALERDVARVGDNPHAGGP